MVKKLKHSCGGICVNILVTLNAGYLKPLKVMLFSLLKANPAANVSLYVLHTSLTQAHLVQLKQICPARLEVHSIVVPKGFLANAPTSGRYPVEMYYRIFAAQLLPETVDRILYLDPDLVVLNPLDALYALDFGKNLFAAASHIAPNSKLTLVNDLRLSMPQGSSYVNSGVMLMNISALRREQNEDEVFDYIETHKPVLMLPDQDVLNAVYATRILPVDHLRYNLSERSFHLYNLRPENWEHPLTLEWVRQNTVIVHYCGRNKPWKENYIGNLNCFYLELEQQTKTGGLL